MHTTSYWLTLPHQLMATLPYGLDDRRDGVVGLAFAMRQVAQLLLMCDRQDIGISIGAGDEGPAVGPPSPSASARQAGLVLNDLDEPRVFVLRQLSRRHRIQRAAVCDARRAGRPHPRADCRVPLRPRVSDLCGPGGRDGAGGQAGRALHPRPHHREAGGMSTRVEQRLREILRERRERSLAPGPDTITEARRPTASAKAAASPPKLQRRRKARRALVDGIGRRSPPRHRRHAGRRRDRARWGRGHRRGSLLSRQSSARSTPHRRRGGLRAGRGARIVPAWRRAGIARPRTAPPALRRSRDDRAGGRRGDVRVSRRMRVLRAARVPHPAVLPSGISARAASVGRGGGVDRRRRRGWSATTASRSTCRCSRHATSSTD